MDLETSVTDRGLGDSVVEAIKALKLENADGEAMEYESHRLLEGERQQVIATAFPECAVMDEQVVAIIGKSGDDFREFIAILKDGSKPELVFGSCTITFEDMSPSECIEYVFQEEPTQYALAKISKEALDTYRDMKFELWRKMLNEPTCEAQFRRMLQIGIVTRMYDPNIFPTPDSLRSLYQVTDEKTGKLINLPHPVSALRVWNAKSKVYDNIDPQLKGAPPEAEKEAWWQNLIKELKAQHGEEYINSFVASDK